MNRILMFVCLCDRSLTTFERKQLLTHCFFANESYTQGAGKSLSSEYW